MNRIGDGSPAGSESLTHKGNMSDSRYAEELSARSLTRSRRERNFKFLGVVGKVRQVTVIFPPDFVVARLVSRKNSSSLRKFEFTNTP